MIDGSHMILFSSDPDADRAFFSDVLELPLMCDDIDATIAQLRAKGVEFTAGISEERWGRVTRFRLPAGGEVGMYEPHHPRAGG